MGKSVKIKQRAEAAKEADFLRGFAQSSRVAAQVPEPVPLINEFTAYSGQFVRHPSDFVLRTRSSDRAKQALEMARYLFGPFRVPRVLEQVWSAYESGGQRASAAIARPDLPGRDLRRPALGALRNNNLKNVDFRAWYVCVATGGSLYKAHTKGLLTKKETHLFLEAPADLDLCAAVVFAVARGAGVAVGLALRLARSTLPLQPFSEFWFDMIRFFCLPDHMPASLHQVNDLVDYIRAQRLEHPGFRLLGSSQTLPAVLRRMEQWHRALARARDLTGVTWTGVNLPDHEIRQKDPQDKNRTITWTLHQVTTGKELAAEGSAQRHCVYGYKARCIKGDCSIWSLSRTTEFGERSRRLTIEMNRFGQLVQKRGLANRLPRPEEEHILDLWIRAAGLSA